MIDEIREAIEKLRELQEYFISGQEKELTDEQLEEAREAIEKLKTVRNSIAELLEILQDSKLEDIEEMLSHQDIESLASFDRDAVYDKYFTKITEGDEDKLASEQQNATDYAQEQYDDTLEAANDTLSALHEKLKNCVDSVDAWL